MKTEKEIKDELYKYTHLNPEKLILIPKKEMDAIRISIVILKWVLNEKKD